MDNKYSKQNSGNQSGSVTKSQGGKTNHSAATEHRAVSSPVPGKNGGTKK
ncbi:hypothetical protein [Candidatus Galacturonibacter soehngenii]|nr:hypothetical protein [Candidatus Galacturonibacter soehngenii]